MLFGHLDLLGSIPDFKCIAAITSKLAGNVWGNLFVMLAAGFALKRRAALGFKFNSSHQGEAGWGKALFAFSRICFRQL